MATSGSPKLAGNRLGRVTLHGVISECSLPEGSVPTDLVTGSDINLWFTENWSNRISRLRLT